MDTDSNYYNISCSTQVFYIAFSWSLTYFDTAFPTFVYYFWCPASAVFGVVGNILSLLAMLKLAKENEAFYLQVVVISNDLVSCAVFLVHMYFYGIHKIPWNQGAQWIHDSSALLRLAVLTEPLIKIFSNCGFNLILSTCAYRIIALRWPQQFQAIEHKKHALIVSVASISIAVATEMYEGFKYIVTYCADRQGYYVDDRFVASFSHIKIIGFLSLFRMVSSVLKNAALTIMAVVVSILYRKYEVQHAAVQGSQSNNQALDSKLLNKLLAIQALTFLLGYLPLNFMHLILYFPALFPAWILLPAVVCGQMGAAFALSSNFGFYFAMSKKFRKILKEILSCGKENKVEVLSKTNVA